VAGACVEAGDPTGALVEAGDPTGALVEVGDPPGALVEVGDTAGVPQADNSSRQTPMPIEIACFTVASMRLNYIKREPP
jgi:hypothetical protein